ncbi:MAG: pilus assembly protein [Oceanococcus sp.]
MMRHLSKLALAACTALTVFLPFQAASEDIEIFSADDSSLVSKPNVLIVIDNSANWSRQSQKWPGGLTQGQSEARAIKKVIESLDDDSINVGLLEYSTAGNANTNEGGYIRYHIRPLNANNKVAFSGELDTIFNNINDPIEKRSSGNAFGTLFWDIYNYLGGFNQSQTGSGTPASRADSAAYSSQYSQFRSPLTAVDFCRRTIVIFIGNNVQSGPSKDGAGPIDALANLGGDTTDIPFAEYQVTEQPIEVSRGYSNACYLSAAACTSAEDNAECGEQGFDSCYCSGDAPSACLQSKYTVVGTKSVVTDVSQSTEVSASRIYTGESTQSCILSNKVPAYSCPADTVTFEADSPNPGQTTRVTESWSQCQYEFTDSSGCKGQKGNYEPRGFRTITRLVTEETSTSDTLGLTSSCSFGAASCNVADYVECTDSTYSSCVCTTPSTTDGCAASTRNSYEIVGKATSSVAEPTGTFSAPTGGPWVADEWARFLRQQGVPLPGSNGASFSQVSTYSIDVFNAQQNADFSGLLFNIARAGGGKYYQATNEDEIVNALSEIFDEIQAVNSAFSSASLPVNATNRSQSENQVYIGVFKPNREKKPRWFGNLKRYQLVVDNALSVELGDSLGQSAVNNQTGFISDCAVSYWTTDSGNYWRDVIADDPPAISGCAAAANKNSDLPDGPFVEKGAVAQRLREGNSSLASPDANGDYAVSRNIYTSSGNSLVALSSSSLVEPVKSYAQGADTGALPQDEDSDSRTNETRASIHGDVIHSRPQPINFGGTAGVVVYYGSNDGAYRAVRGSTGEEIWSFIAPEHLSRLSRLQANTPAVNLSGGINGKPYFFDGSTGVFQNESSSEVIIYPSQRRGGRKVYAFDVATPLSAPTLLWSRGCPNLGNDAGCDAGFNDIGQTWSRPLPAFIEGFSDSSPVLIFAGGADACEDEDSAAPSCSNPKGAGVYVLNAKTGALIKYFDFSSIDASERSAVADVALADPSGDGKVDFAYAVTAGGSIYRLDFSDANNEYLKLDPADWVATKVAYTSGAGRKFLYPPSIVISGDEYYIAIGSGDREHPLSSHYTASVTNRFYVFRDDLTDIDSTTALNLDDTSLMANYTADPGCDPDSRILPSSTRKGWFIDLTAYGPGEQVVTTPVIAGGQVFFSTNRPTPPSDVACTSNLGQARGYILSLLNGSGAVGVEGFCGGDRSDEFTGGGLPPSPVVATVPIEVDGEIIVKTVVIGAADKDGGPSSIIGAQEVIPAINSARRPVSWRRNTDTD